MDEELMDVLPEDSLTEEEALPTTRIGKEEVQKATETLMKYKQGKANLERRVVEDELWWELRHWEVMRKDKVGPEPSSAWLFNAVMNKHADAMDNFPEPIVLPREQSDEESAKTLTSILPVIMEQNGFEQTYSDASWEKLKHGTAVYGVFYNTEKENGLGDVEIRPIDLLKIFWEPGVTDIQDSRNLFILDLVDRDILDQMYPDKKGKFDGSAIDVKEYLWSDNIDTSEKAVVVDWYYKLKTEDGRTVLHYCKFCNNEVLYASENEPMYAERGYYDHGMYPVVFDTLYPEKGTPVGFGMVAICKDPQIYIDKLSSNIMETSMMGTKRRFFMSDSTNVSEEELLDWTKPIIHVSGEINDTRIKELDIRPVDGIYYNVLTQKIDEMKETSGNRDVNSGGAGSGITAAASIAALQAAGNKGSRDFIMASYRSFTKITTLVIELIRQFYDEVRSFRITGELPGEWQFQQFDNSRIRPQQIGFGVDGNPLFRKPVFDLKVKAQKANPFSRIEMNELAKGLYAAGFFSPERATEASLALDMMDFEGIEKVKEKVAQGQTLLNICQQMAQQMDQMAAVIQALTGKDMGTGTPSMGANSPSNGFQPTGGAIPSTKPQNGENSRFASGVMQAQKPMTSYGQRLAERSKPSVD